MFLEAMALKLFWSFMVQHMLRVVNINYVVNIYYLLSRSCRCCLFQLKILHPAKVSSRALVCCFMTLLMLAVELKSFESCCFSSTKCKIHVFSFISIFFSTSVAVLIFQLSGDILITYTNTCCQLRVNLYQQIELIFTQVVIRIQFVIHFVVV